MTTAIRVEFSRTCDARDAFPTVCEHLDGAHLDDTSIEVDCTAADENHVFEELELALEKVLPELRGGFSVRVTQVRENRVYAQLTNVDVPWSDHVLALRWEHFTSHLLPGQHETWTAVVTGPDAKRSAAELVAFHSATADRAAIESASQPGIVQAADEAAPRHHRPPFAEKAPHLAAVVPAAERQAEKILGERRFERSVELISSVYAVGAGGVNQLERQVAVVPLQNPEGLREHL